MSYPFRPEPGLRRQRARHAWGVAGYPRAAVKLILSAIALGLAGCSLVITESDLLSADYGTYPSDFEDIVHTYMDGYLRDSASARYKFLNPPAKFAAGGLEKKFGYIVCVDVNGKNSFGAYAGYRRSYFLINNGKIVDFANSDGTWDSLVQTRCKSAA